MLACFFFWSKFAHFVSSLVSVFFLLKELRLGQDLIRHSGFVNSANRRAENMLHFTEN